jgi:hypothetical protein
MGVRIIGWIAIIDFVLGAGATIMEKNEIKGLLGPGPMAIIVLMLILVSLPRFVVFVQLLRSRMAKQSARRMY